MTPDFFLTNIQIGGQGLSISIGLAIVTGVLAASKGRNFFLWALIGGLSCVGLIVLLFLPDVSEEKGEGSELNREQRRLNERLKQERLKNREFQSSVLGRLDSHDVALEVDTRNVKTPLETAASLPIQGETPIWYYEDQNHAAGPISRSALQALFNSGAIDHATLIWREGMDEWAPFKRLRDSGAFEA